MTSIGISIGTNNYYFGIWDLNQPKIIENDFGKRATPAYVSFSNNELFIGEQALFKSKVNAKNTIFGSKRLIGNSFFNEEIQSYIKYLSFNVIEKFEKPYIQVEFNHKTRIFSPEEIISMHISQIIETSKNYSNKSIKNSVISVPANFTQSQKIATINACKVSGLKNIQLISEPLAAAISYGFNNGIHRKENILIFDFGSGTYDVSLINIDHGTFKVLATAGNTHLGGNDFDHCLIDHCINEFKNEHKIDISKNPKAMNRLREACNKAKHILTDFDEAPIEIQCLSGDLDFYTIITRSVFEQSCSSLFEKLIEPINKIFIDTKIDKSSIQEILFVGGSTRIPKFREIISSYFNGKVINKTVNCDEAVALGSTILASVLSGEAPEKIKNIKVFDVIPYSFNISIQEENKGTIIQNNSSYPMTKIKTYSVPNGSPSSISIKSFENNVIVKELNLTKIDSSHFKTCIPNIVSIMNKKFKKGSPKYNRFYHKIFKSKTKEIEIQFEIDKNGLLHVSMNDKKGNRYMETIDSNDNKIVYEKELNRMIKDAKELKIIDSQEKERKNTMNNLEKYVYDLLRHLNNETKGTKETVSNDIKTIDSIIEWVDDNRDASKEDYDNYIIKLKDIAKKYNINLN